jgi:hypothetical protein
MNIQDCEAGSSYACKYRTITWLDAQGSAANAPRLEPGQTTDLQPGVYESIGVIQTRDLDRGLVRVLDTNSNCSHTVSINDIWDIDTIEWQT